jgi:hypothetical protein
MRPHPIPPVTEPLQYRAIGVVRGIYEPIGPEQLTRGLIRTESGDELEAVVLGRLLTLMRRHLDLSLPHLWVVYPRSREQGGLHLQMVGVWEPSTLTPAAAAPEVPPGASESMAAAAPDVAATEVSTTQASTTEVSTTEASITVAADVDAAEADAVEAEGIGSDALPEGDDYFSVRGELIFTKPETGDLVVKVRQLPRPDGQRPTPFKLQIRGEVPLDHLRHFIALDLRRQGQLLQMEAIEVLAPVNQRGNRGGKGRRDDRRPAGGARGGGRRGGGEAANGAAKTPAPRAVVRPGR